MSERPVLWIPRPERVARARLTQYAQWLAVTRGVRTASYAELWAWSVENLEEFWSSVIEFCDLRFEVEATRVLDSRAMPGANWFPGATLSYAEHVFRAREPEAAAIHHASELRPLSTWSWGELTRATSQLAGGLRAAGVGPGDRVAAYMPNIPETVAAFFACASIGAVWSCAAPEFGARSVIDRFSQIEPKVLLAVDGYRYGGQDFDRRDVVAQIHSALPPATLLVTFGYLDGSGWDPAFVEDAGDPPPLEFAALPFSHPLWVLFSSGTTGLPKPIVHSQGGILLEHVKAAHLHLDAQSGDRLFWFTTTGWMMWNLLIGGLLTDASIVLYDGNPGYPDMGRLWDLMQEAQVTCMGISPAFINASMKAGVRPRVGRDLRHLRAVGSTGSPLAPEGFRWLYENVGDDLWVFSTSGGTDVCTTFVGGVPTLPVREGELQARALGAAVEAWSEDGQPVLGQVGELVITEPMPSMPIYFWGDQSGERYRESYFTTFPGVWRHGDWIEITPEGGAVISGRSDSTINRNGVRIGTGEIYRAVLGADDVLDALVVDLPRNGTDGWIELFVVLRPGSELSDELVATLRRRLRDDCSPRHLPDHVTQVTDLPHTLSGKLLEIPVKRILLGAQTDEAVSRESLANPESLDAFIALASTAGSHGQRAAGGLK